MARSVKSLILGLAALFGFAACASAAHHEVPAYDVPPGHGRMVVRNEGRPDVIYPVEAMLNAENGLYELRGHWQNDEYLIDMNVTLDPDPQISYGIAVTDFGAPSLFSFTFTTPIIFGGGPSTVSSSVVGGLTDFGGNGVSITPSAGLGDPDGDTTSELQVATVGVPPTNMGVDVGLAQTHPAGNAGANYTYGAYTAGPIAGPGVTAWTSLQLDVAFTLSGGSDTAVLTGFASIVPEPSSVVMALAGVAGLVAAARRRRRA